MASFLKHIRYGAEALLLLLFFIFFKCLPAQTASNIGGWLGRTIGPRLAASRKALRNLERVLPELSKERHDEIIRGMWDNLGRIIAEYPHLEYLSKYNTHIENKEKLLSFLKNSKNGLLFFGGHFGNWEINCSTLYTQADCQINLSYRAPNNPWTDKLLMHARTLGGRLKAYPKSMSGGRSMMKTLQNHGVLGILIDQKYNEGLNVPFFGLEAMTNPFFVQLAQKYNIPLVPFYNSRFQGAHFTLKVYDAIPVFDANGQPRAVEDVIAQAHALLENWIRDAPEQWLWLHRRWKD